MLILSLLLSPYISSRSAIRLMLWIVFFAFTAIVSTFYGVALRFIPFDFFWQTLIVWRLFAWLFAFILLFCVIFKLFIPRYKLPFTGSRALGAIIFIICAILMIMNSPE